MMDDGLTTYSDAIEGLRQKVIRNFFTEPDTADADKSHSIWNEVDQ